MRSGHNGHCLRLDVVCANNALGALGVKCRNFRIAPAGEGGVGKQRPGSQSPLFRYFGGAPVAVVPPLGGA